MPRPERPLDERAGPVQAFAADLRRVREKAGSPKYLQMARATGRSRTALAEAAGGDHLATWETVEAYLNACGESPSPWQARWEQVRAFLDEQRRPDTPTPAPPKPDGPEETAIPAPALVLTPPGPERDHRPGPVGTGRPSAWWRWRWLMAGGVVLAGAAAVMSVLLAGRDQKQSPTSTGSPTDPVTVVVQNQVVSGPKGFYEDDTPVYLSTRTVPKCSAKGCEVPDTNMWSGAVLQVLCTVHGATLTNENLQSPGVATNPHGVTSDLWYRAKMPNGTVGFISEVYLTPASRGGRNLPGCPPS
ncbi:hypothetical protein [Streptomyces sp. NPDC126522]|uniref:transcriptional regulator n=1 Tax=Streptomyces sp. NPDC126522 TaxID=3155211 RepID=UPI00332F2092